MAIIEKNPNIETIIPIGPTMCGCTATWRRRQSPERWTHLRPFWPSLGRDRSTGSSPRAKSTGRVGSRLFWPLPPPTGRGLWIGRSAGFGSPVLGSAAEDTGDPACAGATGSSVPRGTAAVAGGWLWPASGRWWPIWRWNSQPSWSLPSFLTKVKCFR